MLFRSKRINRNGNLTTESQRLELLKRNSEGKLVDISETNKNDTDKKIIDIIGLSRDQFTKVIMLPQNEFENFLKSSSINKAEILKDIFPIEIYSKFEKELIEYKKELYKKIEGIRREIEISLERITEDKKDIESLENTLKVLKKDYLELKKEESINNTKISEKSSLLDQISEKNRRIKRFLENVSALMEYEKYELEAKEILDKSKRIEESKIIENNENILEKTKKALFNEKNKLEKNIENLNNNKDKLEALNEEIKEKLKKDEFDLLEEKEFLQEEINELNKKDVEDKYLLKELNENLERISKIKERTKKLEKFNEELIEIKKKEKVKNDELTILNESYDKSGLLAYKDSLIEGEACPLCGSIHHPSPIKGEAVSKKEIDKCQNELNEITKEKIKLTSNIENLTEQLSDNKDMALDEKEINLEIKNINENSEIINKKIKDNKNLNDFILTVEEKISNLREDEIKLSTNNKLLKKSIEKRKKEEKENTDNFNDSLYKSFENIDEYRKLLLEKNEILSKKLWAEDVKESITKLRAIVEENIELKDEKIFDTKSIEEELNIFLEKRNKIGESKNSLYSKIVTYEEVIKNVKDKNKKLEKNEEEYNNVEFLSNLTSGNMSQSSGITNPKVTLETFVLSNYFDRILKLSNLRLKKISNERYIMRRKEDYTGNKKSGLDVEIFDATSGIYRQRDSLSGGEVFIVSLSLALGLADEISNNSGVLEVENLFIDEGFGSLDQETLETSMDVLLDISGEGKLIGIISHVESMKERIANKVVVKKLNNGKSTVELEVL